MDNTMLFRVSPLLVVFVLGFPLACGDDDVTDDTSTATGSATEDEDTATGSDTGLVCPINSGYPCACDLDPCEDGTECLGIEGLGTFFCAAECTQDKECEETMGWGSGAGCLINSDGDAEPDHCVVKCEDEADCPPGLACLIPQDGATWMGCF